MSRVTRGCRISQPSSGSFLARRRPRRATRGTTPGRSRRSASRCGSTRRSSACSTTRPPRRPCSTRRSGPCSTRPRTCSGDVSHHLSGPRAVAEPIADITDLYAFPSPERAGRMVLVLNTLPFASPDARFSDALIYRFRLRPVRRNAADAPAPLEPQPEEHVVDCVFSTPEGGETGPQDVTCTLPGGGVVTAQVGYELRGASAGARVFAGTRWDPFILDAPAALRTIATGQLAFTDPSSIYLDGKNVLSLVVELDCR